MSKSLSDKARAFLEAVRFCVLATTNRDGTAQLSVMWYALDGDEILMNTAAGRRKVANMRHDPRIAICIEDDYNYLSISGIASLIEDPQVAQADIHRLATRYRGAERAAEMMRETFGNEQRITIRMRISNILERI
jgi:PPOX class probable F420-dependent enzyme